MASARGLRTDGVTGQRVKVTEPGGRCLWFIYGTGSAYTDPVDGTKMLQTVEAYDYDGSPGVANHPAGNRIDWVSYSYTDVANGRIVNGLPEKRKMLTGVTYSDGTAASYTYVADNVPNNVPLGSWKYTPLLATATDVRYKGAMRTIFYEYQSNGPHGAIMDEKNPGVGAVSAIFPGVPSPTDSAPHFPEQFTETRGDGPTRTFTYTPLQLLRNFEGGACPDFVGDSRQQFLLNYTDFENQTTYLGYDTNWYVNSVRDANGHTTTYARASPPPSGIGQITQILHPDGTHIDYTYQTESGAVGGHYVATVSNERQKVTTYTRDPTKHVITEIDYPSDATTPASTEGFIYNLFGQVTYHLLRNGAWESFVYDGRGLLTDKYNPKFGGAPGGSDPHAHYDYYTSADGKLGWIDRVKKMTLPANYPFNLQATETYEYDRNGRDRRGGGRRGLVTKITHTDNTYQSFGYDAYGNKRWEENELRQRSNYTLRQLQPVAYC